MTESHPSGWKKAGHCEIHCGLFEQMYQNMPDGMYLIDPKTSNILEVNDIGCSALGMEKNAVLGSSVLSLQKDVAGIEQWREIAEVIRSSSTPYVFYGRHYHRDGGEFPVEVLTSCFNWHGQEYFLSIARDITNRVVADQQLANRKDSLWYALNESADGIWEWKIPEGSVFFSNQLKRMLGYGPEELPPVIASWESNIHPDDLQRVIGILQDHLAGHLERYEAIYRLKNRNGHYLWVHDRGKVSERNEQGEPICAVGMVQDITHQKNLQERLESQAAYDELTGAYNRRECRSQIMEQLDYSRIHNISFSLCLLDLDHFKAVNDQYGHNSGDLVLKQFVKRIQSRLRRDDRLFRWGGEEFVLLYPKVGHEAIVDVAENIRLAVAEAPYLLEGEQKCSLTTSIGLATFPNDGDTLDALISKADIAMYRAKANGRDRVEQFEEK